MGGGPFCQFSPFCVPLFVVKPTGKLLISTSSCGVTTTTQASQPERRVSGGVSCGAPGKGGVGEVDFYPVLPYGNTILSKTWVSV